MYYSGGVEEERKKRKAVHLKQFIDSLHCVHHWTRESRSCWRYMDDEGWQMDSRSLVSSAKRYDWQNVVVLGMSFTNMRNNKGPRILPCGTPDFTGRTFEELPSTDNNAGNWTGMLETISKEVQWYHGSTASKAIPGAEWYRMPS